MEDEPLLISLIQFVSDRFIGYPLEERQLNNAIDDHFRDHYGSTGAGKAARKLLEERAKSLEVELENINFGGESE